MPELPEVEIVRRKLAPLLEGRKISAVRTGKPSYFFLTPPKTLIEKLEGRTVRTLKRHGKYLISQLDDGSTLLWHLGMTGQLLVQGAMTPRHTSTPKHAATSTGRTNAHKKETRQSLLSRAYRPELTRTPKVATPDPHVHLVLEFADRGPSIAFRDVRKFGKCRWLKPGVLDPRLKKLGVDALEVTGAQLFEKMRKRSAPIKSVLLDQGVLAGVGNIYADEALFLSKLRPTRAARSYSRSQVNFLATNVQAILAKSIELGGSSISDYLHPDGEGGGFQQTFAVYGREGEPCSECGGPIAREVLGQRSTHFCPKCQR
ncbi:MAG: bifunctional DNA-formamidopyrimidine glycosylase/DNA-(apurinic or apyrimidinic site) lyase [Polyangiaceae bacterium]|nr:bifunctional DNA-formamidopyrimidine glycosylase/DNA-(apurinic or apyrimidinic site) lyase [Polyangiaceae bacterium]